MTSLMAFCSSHAAAIIFVRLGPRPGDLDEPLGSRSMMSSVSTPKWVVIRSAITGPMP